MRSSRLPGAAGTACGLWTASEPASAALAFEPCATWHWMQFAEPCVVPSEMWRRVNTASPLSAPEWSWSWS